MKIKIAAFGRRDVIDRVLHHAKDNDEVEIVPFIYTKIKETDELIDKVVNCDVYLFTEELSYLVIKEKAEKKRLPVIKLACDAYKIATSFYRLHAIDKKPLTRIAIDVAGEKDLLTVIEELDLDKEFIQSYIHDTAETPDMEQLVKHYEQLWNEKKIDHVITSAEEVKLQLLEMGIPASTISVPDSKLFQAVEEAISLAKLSDFQNNQIVSGFISPLIDKRKDNDEDLEKLKQILKNFADKTNSFLIPSRDNDYIIVGTDKLLHHLKSYYREFPLIDEMNKKLQFSVHLGFGLGLHAKESAENAEIAIGICKRSKQSISYIVNERQETIGPIGIKKEIDTSRLYHALIHKARLNNELSYNFIDFIQNRNNEPFSSNDIATFYKVTKRSAERTVNKLLSGEVIKVSGEERPYVKGRPRKLFTLNQ